MTKRSPTAAILAAAGLLLLGPGEISAQDEPVRLLVSNGMKATMEALERQCERAIGRPLAMQFASTASVKQRIQAAEEFDATIITTEAIDKLIQQGKLSGASRTELGRSVLGIGIRAGSLRPDIHTPEALKRTLLAAKTITYPKDGASRGFIEQMFERMGISGDLKSRVILADGSGPATESVAQGRVQFVITLFSEIVPVRGAEILGPLPGEFQSDIRFSAASSPKARNPEAVKALIALLGSPKVAATFQSKGVEHR
jgi:molybdate transport system substrate-binding protein